MCEKFIENFILFKEKVENVLITDTLNFHEKKAQEVVFHERKKHLTHTQIENNETKVKML